MDEEELAQVQSFTGKNRGLWAMFACSPLLRMLNEAVAGLALPYRLAK